MSKNEKATKPEAKVSSVIHEVFYQKPVVDGVPQPIRVIVGELGVKYRSHTSDREYQQVIQTDPETGDLRVMNLPTENIRRIQPQRMI